MTACSSLSFVWCVNDKKGNEQIVTEDESRSIAHCYAFKVKEPSKYLGEFQLKWMHYWLMTVMALLRRPWFSYFRCKHGGSKLLFIAWHTAKLRGYQQTFALVELLLRTELYSLHNESPFLLEMIVLENGNI
ncbi:uncharacterized protein [Euphorbia lathyris]|uniref:uncharacterized protein n=1 Tax=Euphorbia lathyris TaxID=212925 RepID=UPI0033140AE4